MSTFMTYDYWYDNFKPIYNKLTNDDENELLHFETYGDEVEFINAQANEHVWTEVDGDAGTYIIAGKHFVNRIHYYVTEVPWTDEYTEIPTWCYRRCDCTELDHSGILDFYGDYDPNCTECEEGDIDIPVDTVLDLKNIYGEDANIVG